MMRNLRPSGAGAYAVAMEREAPRCAALLEGHTLYAVQPALNRVAVVRMAADYMSGEVIRYITEPFASNPAVFPTTIAAFGDSLYAVTFGGDPTSPDYVVRMPK